jgi:predicted tellurium resistance membrane protein TerC
VVFGLLRSIGLMGLAAGIIARPLERWRWLSYLGLAFILYIALQMIWDGGFDVYTAVQEKS